MSNYPEVEQWKDARQRDGWDGELHAADWLVERGWTIESHRFRLGRNDLDLIARKADLVAFVEVKVRKTHRCGTGEEAITPRKRRIIERVAWAWILRHGKSGDRYRFDAIALSGEGPGASITHIEDAWRPGWR